MKSIPKTPHPRHGLVGTPEHRAWITMRYRCSPNNLRMRSYYYDRGIRVCDRWGAFLPFLEDMGDKPSPAHTLERINNDGDYGPENCRWATRAEQGWNQRSNVLLTHNGQTKNLREWGEELGVDPDVLRGRIKKGWDPARVLTPHLVPTGRRACDTLYTYQGETLCLKEWADRTGIGYSALWRRIKRYGMTFEQALTTPARPYRRKR